MSRRPSLGLALGAVISALFVLAALLIYTHRANIGRLRAGNESRVPLFGRK